MTAINIIEKKITPKIPLTAEEKKLLALVDDKEEEIAELLQELVKINSLNYSEFQYHNINKIFDFTKNYMDNAGFKTELFKAPFFSNKKNEFYYNLIASYEGEDPGKTLQFNGHLDIVPFNPDKWDEDTPPLGGVIKEGKLYGRGSVDMKAGIACQMIAMKLLKDSEVKIKGKLQMWFTPDEETHGAYGSAFMVKNHLDVVNADATIVSEPTVRVPLTSPGISLGEKGPHWMKFIFHGVAGHGSWPKIKSSALNKAVRFMSKAKRNLKFPKRKAPVTKWQQIKMLLSRVSFADYRKIVAYTGEKSPLDKDKTKRGKILYNTTFSFNQIKAGVKTNVIPDTCELEVDFRAMPGLSTQQVFDAIVKYCTKLNYRIEIPEGYTNLQHSIQKFKDEPVDITISILTVGEGSASDPNSEFGKLMQNAFTALYETSPIFGFMTGFSDGGNMREAGMKDIFILGPGGRNAHTANEYAEIKTFRDITKLYLLIAYRYLKK
ncbi:MAG: M20 family metallopeptidase [Asgard group archaeon]|nr:M20 family metallopeptidase [Asgard group archaeon]